MSFEIKNLKNNVLLVIFNKSITVDDIHVINEDLSKHLSASSYHIIYDLSLTEKFPLSISTVSNASTISTHPNLLSQSIVKNKYTPTLDMIIKFVALLRKEELNLISTVDEALNLLETS